MTISFSTRNVTIAKDVQLRSGGPRPMTTNMWAEPIDAAAGEGDGPNDQVGIVNHCFVEK